MYLSYFTLFVALSLSAVAAWYSIIGLTAIFAAAVIPIVIMGTILEVAKVTITVWLHEYWDRCRLLMKAYLVPAVAMLMFITSMGIFGFLSKAHSDQSLVSGDVLAQVSIIDEKIKIERENIDNAQAVIRQMDAAVSGVITSGDQEVRLKDGSTKINSAAERSLQIRRSQSRDRANLIKQIEQSQARIVKLQEESAPIRAEVRKVEAEVGPIKYIAAMVYGDNPDANLLERAVRWVIILLVVVFDPLAIMMVLAATESLKWQRRPNEPDVPKYAADDGALTDSQIQQIQESAPAPRKKSLEERYPYLFRPFDHFKNLKPLVAAAPVEPADDVDAEDSDELPEVKAAIKAWKRLHPDDTIKHQRRLLEKGEITELPWLQFLATPVGTGYGKSFPKEPRKGDVFVKIDQAPHQVYKFNGSDWIKINKDSTDSYIHDSGYLEFLIEQIQSGGYDIAHLTDAEQEAVRQRLSNT